MKRKVWKAAVCAFALAVVLCLTPVTGRAVLSDVYFTAVNEQLLDMSSDTMPFWSGGVLYVSSSVFEGTDLGVNYVRNNSMGLAMLYTNKVDLRFDLEDQMAYDKRGNVYSGHAIERGGVIFFPLDLVCRYFSLTWSYSQTDTVPLVRIKSASGILDDTRFIDAAATQMADRYAAYEKSLGTPPDSGGSSGPVSPPPSQPEDNTPQTVQAAEGQKVYLIIDVDSRENALEAMQILGSVQGTFLLDAEEMADGDLLRALTAGGHGTALRTEDMEELENARDLMWQGCCTWLDLVWCEDREADAWEESGCFCMEAGLEWRGRGLRNGEQATDLLWAVSEHREDLAVYLGSAGDCTGGLGALKNALAQAGYRMCAYRP